MKKRLLLHALIGLLPSAALAEVTTHGSEMSATFEGVALKAVLEKAGVEFGHFPAFHARQAVGVVPSGGSCGWLSSGHLPSRD